MSADDVRQAAERITQVSRADIHDLANHIGAVVGFLSLASMDLTPSDPAYELVVDSQAAAERAVELLNEIRSRSED
jgi:hypothetical protein